MQAVLKAPVPVQCVAGGHQPSTIAQFRHDDEGGWGRIHSNDQHDLLWDDGEIRVKHHAKCGRCGRDFEFREERLYRHLDWALANGKPIRIG